jgi:hypothetical protein
MVLAGLVGLLVGLAIGSLCAWLVGLFSVCFLICLGVLWGGGDLVGLIKIIKGTYKTK